MVGILRGSPAGWSVPLVLAVCLTSAARAQPAPNTVASGKQLAQQYCATCHLMVPSGQRGWTDAPPFDVIANRPDVTAAQLSAVAQKPHMHMLHDQRPKDEADAIATYIMSLRKR